MEKIFDKFCRKFLELHDSGQSIAVVTMTGQRGSAPQETGARMIVSQKGIEFGTVGGGKIEKKCLEVAGEMLRNSQESSTPQSFTWNLQKDIGMSCGGEVSMFFETFKAETRWNIVVFGAGHVSQELTRILIKLDCNLTVVDPRMEWLDKLPQESERFKKKCIDSMKDVLDQIPGNSFVALMTMGHSFDAPILEKALNSHSFPFLGVIGSDVKRLKIEKELRESGYQGDMNFQCPIGEDFGSNAPAEIALSIAAQLIKFRDQKKV